VCSGAGTRTRRGPRGAQPRPARSPRWEEPLATTKTPGAPPGRAGGSSPAERDDRRARCPSSPNALARCTSRAARVPPTPSWLRKRGFRRPTMLRRSRRHGLSNPWAKFPACSESRAFQRSLTIGATSPCATTACAGRSATSAPAAPHAARVAHTRGALTATTTLGGKQAGRSEATPRGRALGAARSASATC
jgi:hypothetical protein